MLLLLLISSFGFAQKQVETLPEAKKAKEGKLYFESKSKGLFLFDGDKYQTIIGEAPKDTPVITPPITTSLQKVNSDGFLKVGENYIKELYIIGRIGEYNVLKVVFNEEGDLFRLFQSTKNGAKNLSLVELSKIANFTPVNSTILNEIKSDKAFVGIQDGFVHPVLNENMGSFIGPVENPKPVALVNRGINIWGGFGDYKDDQSDLAFNYNQERLFLKDLPYRNQRPWYAKDVAPYKVPHHNQKLAEKGIYTKTLDYVDQVWVFDQKEAADLYQQFLKAKISYATFLCYNEGAMVTVRDQFIAYIEQNNIPFEYYFTISFDSNRKDVMDFVASKMKSKWYKKINGKAVIECFTDGNDFQKGIDVKNKLKSQYGIDTYLVANENIGLSNVERLKGNYDCVTKYYNASEIGSQRPNAIFDGTSGLKEEWQKAKDNGLDYLPILTLGIDRSARNAQYSHGVTWYYDYDSVMDNIPEMVKLCKEIAHPQLGYRISHLDENSEQGATSLMNKLRADGTTDTRMVDVMSVNY